MWWLKNSEKNRKSKTKSKKFEIVFQKNEFKNKKTKSEKNSRKKTI